jgi:hypothetical protein
MKALVNTLALTLTCVTLAAWSQTATGQTGTRFVTTFSSLEDRLMKAAVANDTRGAGILLTEDFRQWTPDPPGAPTSREEWFKPDRRDMANYQIRELAVQELDNHAAVSFVLTVEKKAWFIVDIWQKSGSDWRLGTRYLSAIDAKPFQGDIRPTGRN